MSVPYSKWIKLNVGGQYFQTTLTTLLSCPDSLLAKMFDPESGLEPAYSEDGVYFLDANPKYFSVILDWLRYKKIMADSDVSLGNVVEAAKFFGLQELVVALENKILEKKLQKTGTVVIVGDQSGACKTRGNCMGYYFKETNIAYRQAGGEMYLYQAPDGVWHVSETVDGEEGHLRNTNATKAKILPYVGWEYPGDGFEWRSDDDLKIVVSEELKFCNSITLSSTASKYQELSKNFLGKYDRICGDWLNGWPIFKNQKGNYLQVPMGIGRRSTRWQVSDNRDVELALEMDISGDGVTTCPANNNWTLTIYGNKKRELVKLKVTCDVHGNSSH